MSKVRVAGFGVSLDGFSAGIEQSLSDPLGKRGTEIFQWFFHTKTFATMHGDGGGSVDLDDEFAHRAMDNFGAFILGRNMFGPVLVGRQSSVSRTDLRSHTLRTRTSCHGRRNDLPLCNRRN
jgi:hypothetical protein